MQNKRSGNFRDILIQKRSLRESQLKILQNRSSSRDELISATCYPVLLPLPAIYVLRTANILLLPNASYCLLLSQRLHLCGSPVITHHLRLVGQEGVLDGRPLLLPAMIAIQVLLLALLSLQAAAFSTTFSPRMVNNHFLFVEALFRWNLMSL